MKGKFGGFEGELLKYYIKYIITRVSGTVLERVTVELMKEDKRKEGLVRGGKGIVIGAAGYPRRAV